jgi:hypothetical protein
MLTIRSLKWTRRDGCSFRAGELTLRPGSRVFAWQHSAGAVHAFCDFLADGRHLHLAGGEARLDGRALLSMSPLERVRHGLVVLRSTRATRTPQDFSRLVRHSNRILRLQGQAPLFPLEAIRRVQAIPGWLGMLSGGPGIEGPEAPPENLVLLHLLCPRLAVLPVLHGATGDIAALLEPDPRLDPRDRPGVLVVTDDPALAAQVHPDELVHPYPQILEAERRPAYAW